jgi:hypothetical protein
MSYAKWVLLVVCVGLIVWPLLVKHKSKTK